ncbi:MAG: 16S rRNA (cytosine(967)-C(5))-methyltransferase RsmB [Candidatus Helarchaeota archaeon]
MDNKKSSFDKEELATEILVLLELKNISTREAIKKVMKRYEIDNWRIRGSAHRLSLETIKKLNTIDKIIQENLKDGNSFNKMDLFLKNLLRISVYRMKFNKISSQLVTNQAVEIFKKHTNKLKILKFLNAILRQIEKKPLDQYLKGKNQVEDLSFRYFYPSWLIEYLIKHYGLKFTEEFIKEDKINNHVRINTLKISIEEALEKLSDENFEVKQNKYIPECIRILSYEEPATRSKLYSKGMIYIQSKSSMIVSRILDPKKGELIADLCAAPGSKTTHLGQLMENEGMIVAIERFHKRIPELIKNIRKMGVKIAHVINADSKIFHQFTRVKFDKILIDPPCSGTGTFTSRPLIKWKLSPKILEKYILVQNNILASGARRLKKDGILVYSTCSVMIEENEGVVDEFLKRNENFSIIKLKNDFKMLELDNYPEALRLYPHINGSEGFFIAKFQRKY